MRIAQVSPLFEGVPPALYGGTERVVSYLTEELVRLGHEVTLFAAGDSQTTADLVAACPIALWRDPSVRDTLPQHVRLVEIVFQQASRFDVIHFHVDYLHFGTTRRQHLVHTTTLHGRLDLPDLPRLYDEFSEMPVVSISMAQRAPLPHANWVGNVLHGLPADLHQAGAGGDYLAFVGRISHEKRLDRAIEIAERAGLPLKVAAKLDRADRDYYKAEIEPLMQKAHVEFLGELGEAEKGELLRNARALVFPIDWPEPFGLVMIEAMACGTPVIAWRNGSVPEVIDDGVTGFVVNSIAEAVEAVSRVGDLSRRACRKTFERRFDAARMARDYVEVYRKVVEAGPELVRGASRFVSTPYLPSGAAWATAGALPNALPTLVAPPA